MIFVRVRIDKDIINVDHDEIIKNIYHDAVDEALKRARAITEAKGYNKVVVVDVNNSKVLHVLEPLYSLINSWEGVSVFLHNGI